ncbi:hypothetical protein BJ322DRAFT_1059510 [Thelephora terrestris]|uniref:Uncharacterized protein n=1 Tax=Thelephora terrestris TaxID=56493 RepID=A0A9P6HGE9_9AGAM|nr:hypothetical protein BJ322DRAFT_1059510 [Thelephora terrestris]
MFVETIVLDEDAEHQTRLVNAITEQTNLARDSVRTISSTYLQCAQYKSLGQYQASLATSQYAETEPIVRKVTEKLSEISNDLEHRVRPVFRRVADQGQEIMSLKAETVRLGEKLLGLEKRQMERCLEDALLAGEQLKEISNSTKLAALQKAQEAEILSRAVARLIKQSFLNGNEIADLKDQCDERQIEIERLNELLEASNRPTNGKRRFHEMDDNDTRSSPPIRGRSPSSLRLAKRTLASNIHGRVVNTKGLMPWKKSPTIVHQPGKCHGPSKPNPFRNHSKEIRPTVANISSDLPRRRLFQSDWNLDPPKENRRKSQSSLPEKTYLR